ncbi:MAG: histidine kinase dimerization/phospho-acceptor domain-containing protein [Thomasclavelia sp.]
MIKKGFQDKLSIQISAIITCFGILAILTFAFLYSCRDYFFNFVNDLGIIDENTEDYVLAIEDKLIDSDVSINDSETINNIIGSNEIYSILVYNSNEDVFITGSYATLMDDFIISATIYNSEPIYDVMPYTSVLELKDGSITIYAYSYAIAKSAIPYLVLSIIISLIVFIIPPFLFIKRKVKLIINLKDEVTIMSQGDLDHSINIRGNDEIAELSHQIDNLRITLKNNFLTEETNRRANYELVTALSHDLRTPLTSLIGYLDIIRLKKYKNEQQYHQYLNNSIDKASQINELANKMFEYFLVFSKEQDSELTKISLGVIYEYMLENINILEKNGFIVNKTLKQADVFINANINLLKRVINNIFSNLNKYASDQETIEIKLEVTDKDLKLTFKNKKKPTFNYIESNRIGLKSVAQMMKIHEGDMTVNEDENNFTVIISFPLLV